MLLQALHQLRDFYNSGQTQSYAFRCQQLKALASFVKDYEKRIEQALYNDLHKPAIEAFATEIAVLTSEIKFSLKHLASWMKPIRTKVILPLKPAKSYRIAEPLGVALIMAPWNYPIQLAISPLIGAIAAGNTALVKPSEFAPHSSHLLAEALPHYFAPEYVKVIEGDHTIAHALTALPFDYLFFTGSTQTGKAVMRAAAENLTPVTLELGGKSPCVVLQDANVNVAAKRIAWGKFLNAGQTCIAPDYVLVDEAILPALLSALKNAIRDFYGDHPANSKDYGRIVNARHWQRLSALLNDAGTIVCGGQMNETERYIAPTLISPVNLNSDIMQDEIFGPLLPIIPIKSPEEAAQFINRQPKALAMYLFTQNETAKKYFIQTTSSGSICINHTLLQCAEPHLPFGGVGPSGMGAYHGKYSFATFSHYKSIFDKPTWMETALQYPPYSEWLRRVLRWVS